MPEAQNSEEAHEHEWHIPDGPIFVIDTYPEQYPYLCACGAFTHDPETGNPCRTCAPEDYQQRSTDLITLSGGPFDGRKIVRPVNRSVVIRCDPPNQRVQKHVQYERTDDRDVWAFRWNNWTVPFEPRDG
jgi:hypothetical protein